MQLFDKGLPLDCAWICGKNTTFRLPGLFLRKPEAKGGTYDTPVLESTVVLVV